MTQPQVFQMVLYMFLFGFVWYSGYVIGRSRGYMAACDDLEKAARQNHEALIGSVNAALQKNKERRESAQPEVH